MGKKKMTQALAESIMLEQGFHCSQCVMFHTAEPLGLNKDQALKMSGGLGGGCFRGGTCGAVAAGVLSLGLIHGYCKPGAADQNAILISKVRELEDRFIAKYGSIECKELMGGLSFENPDEGAKIMAGPVRTCPAKCVTVCEILDDMLEELK